MDLILRAARESRVLSGGVYHDEPIIRTGRQAFGAARKTGTERKPAAARGGSAKAYPKPAARPSRQSRQDPSREGLPLWAIARELAQPQAVPAAPVPEQIARMRSLARGRGSRAFSYAEPRLFYEQARLMEGYEDDFLYEGDFSRYYPTYEDMTNAELRGYFTWRTRWRAGEAPRAPLSFLFVHAYEILCGVGVSKPDDGLFSLWRLREEYGRRPGNESLDSYLATWTADYVVYHGLDASLAGDALGGSPTERAIATLDRAERALLSSANPGTWDGSLPGIPSASELTLALATASRYRLERSRVMGEWRDELDECCGAVFARMVDHCRRRRKRGYVEGLFGQAEAIPYTIFRSAVFFDPAPHHDCTYDLGDGRSLSCRRGRWVRTRPHHNTSTSAELGDLLHEVDRTLRERKGGLPPLKPREVPKYVRAMVEEVVGGCIARREAEEAARVRIDRSALTGIRAASARTREALLVDEEREETPSPMAMPEPAPEPMPAFVPAPRPAVPAARDTSDVPAAEVAPTAAPGLGLEHVAFLRALLDGTSGGEAAAPVGGATAELLADHINEVLFDLVGDTVIEFDGDVPHIVDDYAEDVREALS